MGGGRGLLPIIFENAFELKVYRIYTFRKRVLVLRPYRTATRVSCGRGPKTVWKGDEAPTHVPFRKRV